ncbi:MAG: hypothetical protein L7R67_03470, partial [Nitrosopumilus sp.]|nr:hypothetical protein [Nitrosopumilus sp.]
DDTSTVLYVPINQTGTYTLLTHSTLFGGNSTTEPITLSAKFTNISSDMIVDSEIPEILLKSDNESPIISDTESDLKDEIIWKFDTGIIIGITLGVAIGLSFMFIIRQKNT